MSEPWISENSMFGDRVEGLCPILKEACRRSCRWHLATGQCAVSVIAIRLDALVEGVPVVRLFEKRRSRSGSVGGV